MTSHIKTTHFWLAWIFASLLVYPMVVICLLAFSMILSPFFTAVSSTFNSASNLALDTLYLGLVSSSVGGVIGLVIGFLQRSVIERYFHIRFYDWKRATIIGGMIAAPVMVVCMQGVNTVISDNYWQLIESGMYRPLDTFTNIMPMVMYVTLMSVIQVVILRRYVGHAWLWIMANATAGFMFSMLVSTSYDFGVSNWMIAAIAQGAVTGFAMLWLLHHFSQDIEIDEKQELAYQHVPIENDEPTEPSEPSVWDDAI